MGTAISVLTGATPLTGKTRTLANEATSTALNRMLNEGPRCCKRASRRAIDAAVDFLEKRMDIVLDKPEKIACNYFQRNRECTLNNCEYYDKSKGKVPA